MMSGAGRKSAYRKSVTEEVLNSFPEPDAERGEKIAQVVQSRGGNILQVRLDDGEESLAILPTKFRKLIWVKRGDYIIVQSASHDFFTAAGDKGKVKFMVEHILYRDQIKHLKEKGFWPELFADVAKEAAAGETEQPEGGSAGGGGGGGGGRGGAFMPARRKADKEEEEGEEKASAAANGEGADEEYDDDDDEDYYESSEDDMSDLHVNTNRLAKMRLIQYDDSDDDDDDDDDEEEEEEES